jgi:hypothetical protein
MLFMRIGEKESYFLKNGFSPAVEFIGGGTITTIATG